MEKEIMTLAHPLWEQFLEQLEGEQGCNFHEKIEGDPKSITWTCTSSPDRPFATAILEKISGIDIEKTMQFFDSKGGGCDCEIIFNIGGNVDHDLPF